MIRIRLKFSEIKRDAFGRIETPVLMLQKPHGEIIGALGDFYGLGTEFKFNEPSVVRFKHPKRNHGKRTKFYDELVGDKLVQIDPYGIFIVTDVSESTDDNVKIKNVECKSLEQELATKRAFIPEGTYNLWNQADVQNSLLGMIFFGLNWNIGTVSISLIGKYRTFPETDGKVLDFLLGEVQKKYGCIFDFDSYTRTVNVMDASEAVPTMPVFLSYKNLLKSGSINENVNTVFTKLSVRGADGIDIRNVNPTGDNYIYNLDYYISNGDIPVDLAAKWRTWENSIFSQQAYYTSVIALRNAANSRRLNMEAELVDLQNNLKTLDNTRATFLQMLNDPYGKESTTYLEEHDISVDDVYEYFNGRLADTAVEYSEIEAKIADIVSDIEAVAEERDRHTDTLVSINSELKMANYFTDDELAILNCYFKEDEFADNTFAVFDVSLDSNGSYNKFSSAPLVFTNVKWTEVECDGGHRMASIAGGNVSISGDSATIDANVVRGTFDYADGEVVCSLYLGSGSDDGESFPSGNLTYTATGTYEDVLLSGMTEHEDAIYSADKSVSHTIHYYTGDITIPCSDAKIYFTRNVTEYQQYSVEQDLYNHAQECMKEIAWPGYEFDVESGNFIFAEKFEPFKNAIQLGCNVHLELDDNLFLKPMLIEIHAEFDSPDDFTLVFSNFFQRPDKSNGFKDLLSKATSTSASIDMSKYKFGQNANTTTWVKEMLEKGLEAAKAQINAGKDQLVTIDQAGIVVDSAHGTSKIYLNNGMVALLDKSTNTVRMAMGHFLNEASGTDFVGILADVIGGTLVAGRNLIIECPDLNGGTMQFKVDSSGVIINNGRMYMKTNVGAMGWDSNYGLFAGVSGLFETTDAGYVHPTCIDPESGEMIFDDNGFPDGVNVWIGIDGKAYFRGNVYAENGYFKGTVQASTFLDSKGNSMMTDEKWKSKYLDVRGLNVNGNFIVDENGSVTINKGSISWDSVSEHDNIDKRISDAQSSAKTAGSTASSVKGIIDDWKYTHEGSTYIDGTKLMTGTVIASKLSGGTVGLLDEGGSECGTIEIGSSDWSEYTLRINSGSGISMWAEGGNIWLAGKYVTLAGETANCSHNNFYPNKKTFTLGVDWQPWAILYSSSSPSIVSDKNKKTSIEYGLDSYDNFFDSLRPLRFKFIDGTSNRFHTGFVSQDIETALINNDLTTQDFAGFIKSPTEDGDGYNYMLRYEEFIALNTWQIQQLKSRVTELEAKLFV